MAIKSLDEETSKLVIRQVEYYFSDSSLPKDNFLKKTISESDDGMVSLALICSFARMRGHLALGEVKPEDIPEITLMAVAETLRKSATSLKLSEDGKKVGRATELIEQVNERTIAASPFEHNVKMEDVESYFSQYGKVTSVRLPRHVADKKLFCGSALVEFSTHEDAEKILTKSLQYGLDLELKPKIDFDAERAIKVEEFKKAPPLPSSNNKKTEQDYPKGLIIGFKLKRKSAIDSSGPTVTTDIEVDGEVGKVKEDVELKASENVNCDKNKPDGEVKSGDVTMEGEGQENEDDEKSLKDSIKKTDAKTNGGGKKTADEYKDNMDVILREDLKSIFHTYGTVKFIDFKVGDESGYIRFEDSESAEKARAAAELSEGGGLIVKNYVAVLEPVTGDAEMEYWSIFKGNRGGRGGRFNRGRGGRGRFSRSRDNDNGNGRSNKYRKVAAA